MMTREFVKDRIEDDFLSVSTYCDWRDSNILSLSKRLSSKKKSDKEKAITFFVWVRDNIKYRVGFWNRSASQTLSEKSGTCTNKANLLVALCRSHGIEAGYGILKTKGQEYFGPVVIPSLSRRIAKVSVHIYAYIKLNQRWVRCDPSADKELSIRTSFFNPQSRLVEWNGENDALEKLNPDHILSDVGPLSIIDHVMSKKPRNASGPVLKVANLYVDFLRTELKNIKNISDLEKTFYLWLKNQKKEYVLYFTFIVISMYRNYNQKKIYRFWKKYMKVYDILNKSNTYKELISDVTNSTDFLHGDKVLDVGSGTGNISITLKKMGCDVVSLDNSEAAINIHKSKDKYATILLHDLREPINLKDNSFDRIICCLTLHIFSKSERERIIEDLYRLVRPDGVLILVSPSVNFSSVRIFADHLKWSIKDEGVIYTSYECFKFFIPIVKMFYYNFILKFTGIGGHHHYLEIQEQYHMLRKHNFRKVYDTRQIYAKSAIINIAVK